MCERECVTKLCDGEAAEEEDTAAPAGYRIKNNPTQSCAEKHVLLHAHEFQTENEPWVKYMRIKLSTFACFIDSQKNISTKACTKMPRAYVRGPA